MKESKEIEKARKILGITKSASENEVKRIYKSLVKKWHPDINKTKEAKNKIQKINHAFQIIMKEQFNKIDPWGDYHIWWWKQFGNDPIWGNYVSEEDKTAITHKKTKDEK